MLVPWTLAVTSGIDWRYFLAGGVACSFSHGVSVPFDVLKTRIQLNPELRNATYQETLALAWEEEGVLAFTRGLGQTLAGYAVQGSLKYGLFNELKPFFGAYFHSQNGDTESLLLTYILAGAVAEVVGSAALTPFEASRIQAVDVFRSSELSVESQKSFLNTNVPSRRSKSVFRSFPAIVAKQVPYTVVQLSSFESLTAFMYSYLATEGVDLSQSSTKFVISSTAALAAGILSSCASHPGDTVLSAMNKRRRAKNEVEPSFLDVIADIYKREGVEGFFKGFRARLVHVCVIVVSQLLVYDSIKQFFGIAATGSH